MNGSELKERKDKLEKRLASLGIKPVKISKPGPI